VKSKCIKTIPLRYIDFSFKNCIIKITVSNATFTPRNNYDYYQNIIIIIVWRINPSRKISKLEGLEETCLPILIKRSEK
jgi:hypothetical protein